MLLKWRKILVFQRKEQLKGAAHSKVRALLEKLQETYVLIEFVQLHKEGLYKIIFFNITDSESLELPFIEGIRYSDLYFEAGWLHKLSLEAQYVYLYLLSLEAEGGYGTWFHVSQSDSTRLQSINRSQFTAAVRELRQENLITVEYIESYVTEDLTFLDFNCLIHTPYFEDWLDQKIDSMVNNYSARKVNQSIRIAKEFLKEKDPYFIEKVIHMRDQTSQTKIDKVLKRFKIMEPEKSL